MDIFGTDTKERQRLTLGVCFTKVSILFINNTVMN